MKSSRYVIHRAGASLGLLLVMTLRDRSSAGPQGEAHAGAAQGVRGCLHGAGQDRRPALSRGRAHREEAGTSALQDRDGLRHVPSLRGPTPTRTSFRSSRSRSTKFATLRDMINWCIEKPNEGVKIDPDSDAMKALEAYIYWSNKGSKLDPGRH